MRIAVFDTHQYERRAFEAANADYGHELVYLEPRLTAATVPLAEGFPAVCVFIHDDLSAPVLGELHRFGVRLVDLRSAGYNNVDLDAARRLGMPVVRVPEYSPYAVAEHAVALLLALNRRVHRAYLRQQEQIFSLEGLVGYDVHGKTVGIVGLGRIGRAFAQIMRGFGCRLLGYDIAVHPDLAQELGLRQVSFEELLETSDIVSLHAPLTPATHHLIDAAAFARMKRGVVLLNTSRGALVDSRALIDAIKRGHLGAAGLDVYEEEEGVFYENLSDQVIQDDVLVRLMSFPNVLITSHQGFLTREALANIAHTSLANATAFERGEPLVNEVTR